MLGGAVALAVLPATSRTGSCALFFTLLAFSVAQRHLARSRRRQRDQDLGQLPRAGAGDGVPRRDARGRDRRGDDCRRLAALARDRRDFLNNLVAYAWFPLRRRPGVPRGDATRPACRPTTASSTCSSSRSSCSRWRSTSSVIGALRDARRRGASFFAQVRRSMVVPVMAVGACGGAAGGRRRLPLRPRSASRRSRCSRRAVHLPAPARAAAAVAERADGWRSWGSRSGAHAPARHAPGRRADRAAAHARPAGPHDRAPQRRGGPLLEGDRDRGRLLGGRAGPRPHRRPAARHRQVHLPGPHPEGRHQAHRRGLEDHQDAPVPGRADRRLGGGLRPGRRDHPGPPRAHRRQGLSARA